MFSSINIVIMVLFFFHEMKACKIRNECPFTDHFLKWINGKVSNVLQNEI